VWREARGGLKNLHRGNPDLFNAELCHCGTLLEKVSEVKILFRSVTDILCSFFFRPLLVHFFCSSKRTEEGFSLTSSAKPNEPKKRRPEMPTATFLGACYTKPYWRYQKGCSSRHFRFCPRTYLLRSFYSHLLFDFKWPQRILGKSDCFEACCGG